MVPNKVRTRYAPSPTGFMHIGNLRTALYEYLIAKSQNGNFVLRIEDTDRERFVDGAIDKIYNTLKKVGIHHDEGPDVGGRFGPYVQSDRMDIYKPYAEKLVKEGKAYYCFCTKERLDSIREEFANDGEFSGGYDRHCRDLDKEEVDNFLDGGTDYVIRHKVPIDGSTSFEDMVFGNITVENKEIQDQVLLKADGFPTYNFANVIDDHLMNITHVVRGSEYLSSTPKYNLLYEAFGWSIPIYIHLPLIMGKNQDGSVSKLSKRHGATSFEDLCNDGYLPKAIINYIALLGWCPKENKEIFSLDELCGEFSVDRISKSPSIFDYDKLNWFNSEYIKNLSDKKFTEISMPYFKEAIPHKNICFDKFAFILKQRLIKFTDIPEIISFFNELPDYNKEFFINKKSKTDMENSPIMLKSAIGALEVLNDWETGSIHDCLIDLAKKLDVKNGTVMWPVRIAASGNTVTPGGAVEILDILGKEESLTRLKIGLSKLES